MSPFELIFIESLASISGANLVATPFSVAIMFIVPADIAPKL